MLKLLLALSAAGCAYFVMNWIFMRSKLRRLTRIERANAEIDERNRRENRVTLRARVGAWATRSGWQGDLAPILVGAVFVYATVVVVLRATGVPEVVGVFLGLPLSVGVVALIGRRASERRQAAFRRQLMTMLGQMITMIESGVGAERALREMVAGLEDPLGSEIAEVLDRAANSSNKDLIGPLKEAQSRYPSRAFTLFIAALEVDKKRGGELAPTLRQAQELLSRDFELTEEAMAEISQTRSEFYIIVGIISAVVLSLLTTSDETVRGAYFSPGGILMLSAFGAWFLFGIYRVVRIFNRAKGGGRA